MKVLILAGGLGTRISEESHLKPKPMIEVGGKPILWHIMKIYSGYGYKDFIVLGGYKSYLIKEYFANYFLHNSDVSFSLKDNVMTVHQTFSEDWTVTVVDTGEKTMTGGRLKRVAPYLKGEDQFMMTYGDGVADIKIDELVNFHRRNGRLATLAAVQPPGRFGKLELNGDFVDAFVEKPEGDGGFINGGFFVLSTKVLNYIDGDSTIWEQEPMGKLAKENQLAAFKHLGFWRPMDTVRDKTYLEELWSSGKAPWKIW